MLITDSLIFASVAALTVVIVAYLHSLWIKDASIIDMYWGLGFVAIALSLLSVNPGPTMLQFVIACLVSIWGLRLAGHIAQRKLGKPEDWRYKNWRSEWGAKFWWQSFYRIFLLQAFLMMLVSAPVIVSSQAGDDDFTLVSLIGISIWLIGFVFESVSDWQLDRFLKKPNKPKGAIMTDGLWRYSRHPNYFGEICQWWGLWIAVSHLNYGWWGLVGPAVITFILLRVSMPMIEEKFMKNPAFRKYASKTSLLIPLPPKRV